jgi:uncharacterized protein YyaL (SSP411 family)
MLKSEAKTEPRPKMTAERRPNRLAGEKSPYLLQHAYNPVAWYPWGPEAVEKSKSENKPIFLSIGYSTCHWCHVMEHESFENDQIAKILNEKFVSIKVDREERPDLDEIYMRAIMAMHGQGGWPLSVFLTPDLKPFYGGTYFPPVPRHGIPGFVQVLEFISDLWTNKRDEIIRDSDELIKGLQQSYVLQPRDTLPRSLLDDAYAQIVSVLDEQYGGFSSAPKFPLPTYLEFLLRYYRRSRKEPALKAVRKTLQSMSAGGIHDHLGGGFHRYSTDRFWLVPHFEKMLYDNAQLARVYLEAYQVTGDRSMLETASDTLEWMLREMRSPEGGFYSAQDADTPDGEGYYYTWTQSEITQAVGNDNSKLVCEFFGVIPEGNFEGGRSILHIKNPLERSALRSGIDLKVAEKVIAEAKMMLLEARSKRSKPAVDDKVISSWNGLAISALAQAYQVTGERKYLDAARSTSTFIIRNLIKEGRLLRRYRGGDAAIDGALDDYAFMTAALLDMYETTFDASWLRESIRLSEKMLELFWDSSSGGFMSSSSNLLLKVKEGYDGPMPSGNAVAALTLLRLAELTGREKFKLRSESTMKVFVDVMESSPFSHTYMMCALDFWFGSREIVVAGKEDDPLMRQMLLEIRKRYLPDKVLAVVDGSVPEISSLTQGKYSIGGSPTVFICQNFACQSPITQLQPLLVELDA